MTVALAAAIARVNRAEVAHDRAYDLFFRRRNNATRMACREAQRVLSDALAWRARVVAEMSGRRWLEVCR